MVNGTVDGKHNKEEKTREVANIIRMYNCSWNFLQLGHDVVMVVDMKVFILSTCLTTLNTGELVVNHTVDGEDNQEEKTMEVADIRMYHFGWNFLQKGFDMTSQ